MKQLRFKQDNGKEFPEPEEMTLGDISERVRRKATADSSAPVMMISAGNGFIYQKDRYSRDNAGTSLKNYTLLKKGELAYNHGYSKIRNFGSCFVLDAEDEARVPYVYHTFCMPNDNSAYFGEYLNCGLFDGVLKGLVSSSVRMDGLLNISYDDYMSLNILRPTKEEQDKVASFLSLYDQKIENHIAKVEALELRRKGILQQIFSQELRFRDDNGEDFPEWESYAMGDLFKERKSKAKGGEELLSVTIANGVIRQSDSDKRDNSSEDKSNYKQVMKGDMAYNTMRVWQGAVGVSYWDGIVSPAYTIIIPEKGVNAEFLMLLFKTYDALKLFTIYSQGMSSDQWNLKFEIFSDLEFDIPCTKEQAKIVELFKLLDKQIKIEKEKLEAIKLVKKGLLQQMFV